MSTSASQASSAAKRRPTVDVSDVEPDAEWKADLSKRIEENLSLMVKGAKDNLETELRKAPVTVEERERLTIEYSKAMENIRTLAEEQFQLELQRERQERRWVAGGGMDPGWSEALKREQQDIMNSINAQKESSSPRTTEPPADTVSPIVKTPPPTSIIAESPTPPVKLDRQHERELERELERKRERERESQSVPKGRRESGTHSSKHRDEISHTLRHATYSPSSDERPPHVESLLNEDMSEESEESLLRPPVRSSAERHEPVGRPIDRPSRSLSERTRRSPKPIPEIWKPSISPEDDARLYTLVRRGSSASMRSTGSAGIRPSISEAIPERADDAVGVSEQEPDEPEEAFPPTEKVREKGKERPSPWNEDRQRVVSEPNTSYEEPDEYSSPRSRGFSPTRPADLRGVPYPASSSTRPIHRKASLGAEDREYSGKYPHRLVPRASFTDDRGYQPGPYQASSSGRPAMRNGPFIVDDRERDRDRDMDRHFEHYGSSRTYPTPPASASRSTARDYSYTDEYDARTDSSYYRDHEQQYSATWRAAHIPDNPGSMPYRRPSENRPGLAREPSYSRNRNEHSSPEDIYAEYDYPASTSIPIGRPRQSSHSDDGWRGWTDQGPPRPRDPRYESDYHRYYPVDPSWRGGPRSPPSSYQSGHRESVNYHNFGGRESRRPQEGDFHEGEESHYKEMVRKRGEEEEDARRKEELRRKETEAKRKEQDARMKLEEERRKEDARREEEARMREARLEEEARRLEEEARILEEEAARKEEENKRVQEEHRKKELEVKRKEAEQKKKEEEMKVKEAEAKKKEQEARKKEQEAKRKEREARRKEEETKKKEAEIKMKEEEARKSVAEAARTAQEALRREGEIRVREEELRRREEELKRREEEASQKEAERLQKQYDEEREKERIALERRRAEEEKQRRERERKRQEDESRRREQERAQQEEEVLKKQQDEFRRREAEIRAGMTDRKRQDSGGSDSAWGPSSFSSPSPSPSWTNLHRNGSTSSASTDRSSATSWNSNSETRSNSTATSATSARQASTTPGTKPRSGSTGSPLPTSPPPAPPPQQFPMTDEQYKQFMREQEQMETARQVREAKKQLTKEDVVRIFERHEEQWKSIPAKDALQWQNFPWPMLKTPANLGEITYGAIHGYLLSPHYLEKDRPQKDRVKDHIKRWHPDRFETKLLPKVVEEDKEKVKEGAGVVVRILNELLTRSNGPGNAFSER